MAQLGFGVTPYPDYQAREQRVKFYETKVVNQGCEGNYGLTAAGNTSGEPPEQQIIQFLNLSMCQKMTTF